LLSRKKSVKIKKRLLMIVDPNNIIIYIRKSRRLL
jgi:hypothetical protein